MIKVDMKNIKALSRNRNSNNKQSITNIKTNRILKEQLKSKN